MNTVNELEVIILQGLPGSGKSTWAKYKLSVPDENWKVVNKDSIRMMLEGQPFVKESELLVHDIEWQCIQACLLYHCNVIVDSTNLDTLRVKELIAKIRDISFLKKTGIKVSTRSFLDTPIEECIRRDSLREFPVGEKVIRDMWENWSQMNKKKT